MKHDFKFNRPKIKRPTTLSLYEAAELFGVSNLSLAAMLRDDKNSPCYFQVDRTNNGRKQGDPTTNHLRYYPKQELIDWWRKRNDN